MTRVIDETPPATRETEDSSPSQKDVYTCHQLRSMIPVIGALSGSVFVGSLFGAFIGYVTMGIICDWMIFNVFKAKDSERIPPHQLEKEEMTGEQYDRLNSFLVKVRRASFGISAGITALHVFLVNAEDYKVVFFGTYALITLFSIFWAVHFQRIVYPYISIDDNANMSMDDHFNSVIVNNPFNATNPAFPACDPERWNPSMKNHH